MLILTTTKILDVFYYDKNMKIPEKNPKNMKTNKIFKKNIKTMVT